MSAATTSRRTFDEPRRFAADARRRWIANVRQYWKYYLAGTFFLVLTNILALEIPNRIGRAMDLLRDAKGAGAAAMSTAYDGVVDAAIAIVVLALLAALARIASRIFIFNVGRFVEYDVRNEVFDHLTRLGPSYFRSVSSGDLTSRVSNDASSVRLLFGFGVLNVVNTAVAFVVALSKMLAISPWLTLWCLAPYPIGFWLMRGIVRAMYRRTRVVQARLSDLTSEVQQGIAGIGVLKSFAVEGVASQRFADESDRYVDENMALARVRGLMTPLMGMLGSLGSIVVLYLGGRLAIGGQLSLGEFVEFSAYVVILAWPTMALGFVLGVWQRGMAAFDRLLEVLHAEPEVEAADGGRRDVVRGAIELRDVSIERGDRRILDDVSLRIEPGEHVALVGLTGSGKSTLIDLIPRLLDPDRGTVAIDGVPLPEWDLHHVRRAIGYVGQEPFLFSTSVRSNVAFGLPEGTQRPEVDEEALCGTLDLAGLSDDIDRFPKGLETEVGERGVTVSGGQKQRMTIARALMLEPAILLLDDAMSSVDPATEREIFESLTSTDAKSTVLMATHRFVGLTRFDRIVVLDEGEVVEEGTHAELLERDGAFASLWRRQQLEEALDAMD